MTRLLPALSAAAAEPRAVARAQPAEVAGAAGLPAAEAAAVRRELPPPAAGARAGGPGGAPHAAIGQPDIVDRMLDTMQTGARRKHPAIEDALDLALKRHL